MSVTPAPALDTGAAAAGVPPTGPGRIAERLGPFVVFALFIFAVLHDLLPGKHRVLSYADGPYFWPSGGFDFLSTWNSCNLGFPFIAQSFTAFQFLPWKLTEPIFSLFGDGFHAFALYCIPFYAASLAAFFLGRRISGSALFGYFAGLFIFLNSFMLEQLLVWPIGYMYCLAGSLMQIHVLWIIHEEGATPSRIAAAILASFLVHHPFWFLINLSVQVLLLGLIVASGRARLRHAVAILAGTILIQSFWLVPFLYNLVAFSVAETHLGSGESAFAGYISTISYRSMFNLMNYPFSLNPLVWQNIHGPGQTIFNYGILVLAILMVMRAVRRRADRLAEMLFFLALYLFFFNFALGPNSEITGALWMWAYHNVPGFGFLRSFNRFNIAAVIALLLLGALLFRSFESRWRTSAILALIIADLACYGIYFSGTFHGMLAMAQVPPEYYQANEKYFRAKPGAVVLSLPSSGYEAYAWAINGRNDLTGQGIYFMSSSYFPNASVILNGYGYNLDQLYPEYRDIFQFHNLWRPLDETAHERLRRLGVTHVMVHKDRIDTLERNDRILPWASLREEFARNPGYVLKEDNAVFTLFEVKDPEPMVSGPGIEYRAISPTRYDVRMHRLAAPVQMKLAQTFNSGWNVYPGELLSGEFAPGAARAPERNRLHFGDIARTFDAPLLGPEAHYEVDGFANAWRLDPAQLRAKLPQGSYSVNPDGSLDVNLMIYFRPQGYFVLGCGVTGFAILACVMTLMAQALANRRRLLQTVPA